MAPHPPTAPAATTLVSDPRYLPPRDELEVDNPQFLKDQRAAYAALPSQIVWHRDRLPVEAQLHGRPGEPGRLAPRPASGRGRARLAGALAPPARDRSARRRSVRIAVRGPAQ